MICYLRMFVTFRVYKIGCEAEIHIARSAKINKLIVKNFKAEHNHVCDKVTYQGYPEVRRLSNSAKADVIEYSKLRAKPTLMKPLLRSKEGHEKIILGRDISNVRLVDNQMKSV